MADVTRLDSGTGALYSVSFQPSPSTQYFAGRNIFLFQVKYDILTFPPDVDPTIAPNYHSESKTWDLRVGPGVNSSLLVADVTTWLGRAGVNLLDALNYIVQMIFGVVRQSEVDVNVIVLKIETQRMRPYIMYDEDGDEEKDELMMMQAELSMNEYVMHRKAASVEAVEALEKVEVSDAERGMSCAVCLEEFSLGGQMKKMPCSHVFHGDCIVKWLKYQCVCPLCRFELPSTSVLG